MCVDLMELPGAFQADDEGSIPFTRSNLFKHLRHLIGSIPTSGLLLIPTNCPLSFRGEAHPAGGGLRSGRLPRIANCAQLFRLWLVLSVLWCAARMAGQSH